MKPSSLNLLLVEDNDANRYILSRLLTSRGAHVAEATTGAEALSMVRQSPDLVLMDIHLPDMTAYDVLQQWRRHTETTRLPVILMSAVEPTSHARLMAESLGVHSFLTLPVLSDDLWIVIEAALRKSMPDGGHDIAV